MMRSWTLSRPCAQCRPSAAARRATCPACGRRHAMGPTTLELPRLPPWIDRPLAGWLRGRDLPEIALHLACVPLLLPLPLAALALGGLHLARRGTRGDQREWLVIMATAALNLGLSLYLLHLLGGALAETALQGLQDLWRMVLPLGGEAPGPAPSVEV